MTENSDYDTFKLIYICEQLRKDQQNLAEIYKRPIEFIDTLFGRLRLISHYYKILSEAVDYFKLEESKQVEANLATIISIWLNLHRLLNELKKTEYNIKDETYTSNCIKEFKLNIKTANELLFNSFINNDKIDDPNLIAKIKSRIEDMQKIQEEFNEIENELNFKGAT